MSDLVAKFQNLALSVPELSKEQKAQSAQWDSVLKTGQVKSQLSNLNITLRDSAFVATAAAPTTIDIELFEVVLPLIRSLSASSKDIVHVYTEYRHILRWISFLQELLQLPQDQRFEINYNISLPREVIEKKKKKQDQEQPEASASSSKKAPKQHGKPDEATLQKLREEAKAKKAAKKAAAAKNPAPQEAAAPVTPALIDFRVGFIQKAIKHPDADSLYVSTIDVGDEDGPRTVCSGLVKHFPLGAMQERYVVVVCNLKPVNMRGVKSTAMVLCGSTDEKVEFVEPPKDSKAGDKVFFHGYEPQGPLKQLNPKKKIWEQMQPHFTTDENLQVIFKDDEDKESPIRKLTNAKGESFKVASIANAQVR